MLVLSRKRQQSVVIGHNNGVHGLLKVTVLEIVGGKVRLGFDVDADVPVHRLEVWERISGNSSRPDGFNGVPGAADLGSG